MSEITERYEFREFFNRVGHHSNGYIAATMYDYRDVYDDDSSQYTAAALSFADCSRSVNIAIDLGEHEIDNTLYKLDTILAGVRGLRKEVAAFKREQKRKKR